MLFQAKGKFRWKVSKLVCFYWHVNSPPFRYHDVNYHFICCSPNHTICHHAISLQKLKRWANFLLLKTWNRWNMLNWNFVRLLSAPESWHSILWPKLSAVPLYFDIFLSILTFHFHSKTILSFHPTYPVCQPNIPFQHLCQPQTNSLNNSDSAKIQITKWTSVFLSLEANKQNGQRQREYSWYHCLLSSSTRFGFFSTAVVFLIFLNRRFVDEESFDLKRI